MKESRLDGEYTSKAAGILKNLADGQRMTWGNQSLKENLHDPPL